MHAHEITFNCQEGHIDSRSANSAILKGLRNSTAYGYYVHFPRIPEGWRNVRGSWQQRACRSLVIPSIESEPNREQHTRASVSFRGESDRYVVKREEGLMLAATLAAAIAAIETREKESSRAFTYCMYNMRCRL